MSTTTSIFVAFALLSFVALTAYFAADFWLAVVVIIGVVTVLVLTRRKSDE